jgi:hypothetical protein
LRAISAYDRAKLRLARRRFKYGQESHNHHPSANKANVGTRDRSGIKRPVRINALQNKRASPIVRFPVDRPGNRFPWAS